MPYRMLYEDAIGKRYLELTRVDNPRFGLKFGWYLLDVDTHAALDGFSLCRYRSRWSLRPSGRMNTPAGSGTERRGCQDETG